MRYIKKQEAPPEFTEWKAQENEDWKPFWNSKATNFRNPQKEIVHQSLLTEQGYICCYCQRRINLNNSHIEHFKPKDESRYPELSLEYTNFLASCQKERINILVDEDQEDLVNQEQSYPENPVHCGHLKKNWYNERLTVSPLDPSCADYFGYTQAGEINGKNEAANITIEKLGLDNSKLTRARRKIIEGYLGGEELQLSKEDIEKLITKLNQIDEKGEYYEFCEVLIYILKQYV
jgi:uncharacterized protein (TIGR02646 family)